MNERRIRRIRKRPAIVVRSPATGRGPEALRVLDGEQSSARGSGGAIRPAMRIGPWARTCSGLLMVLVFVILGSELTAAQAPQRPLSQAQLEGLVAGGVASDRLAALVQQRGVDFKPTEDYLEALRQAGAEEVLLTVLRTLQPRAQGTGTGVSATPVAAGPAPIMAEAVAVHLERGAELQRVQKWTEAEQEYRSASQLDPDDPAIHLALANVLSDQKKWDQAIAEFRETLRRRPNDADAHQGLTNALEQKHDGAALIPEYREVLRLNPSDTVTQGKLAAVLYALGDVDGAIVMYRSLVRSKPADAVHHERLGLALYVQGDLDGAVTEYNEALRLKPDFVRAHNGLGDALLKKGERRAAFQEYLAASELMPNSSTFRITSDWMSTHLEH